MITFKVYNGYNERFAPSGAKKAYLARITGRDAKMTFSREFLGKGDVLVDAAGLYELRDTDKKGRVADSYIIIIDCPTFPADNGDTLRSFCASKEDAMKIAKYLDTGRTFASIVDVVDASGKTRPERTWEFVTTKQTEKADVAHTIDSATEACLAILRTLPEQEAQTSLAAIRVRLADIMVRTLLATQTGLK